MSCAVSDRSAAYDIAQALAADGYRVAPIEMGPAQFAEHYGAPAAVIVVWSAASASSKWVALEAAQALARGALIEVCLQPVRGDAPEAPVAPISFEGWTNQAAHPAMKELKKRLRPLVGGPKGKGLSVITATPWALGGLIITASVAAIAMSLATRAPAEASNTAPAAPERPIVVTGPIDAPKVPVAKTRELRTAGPLQTTTLDPDERAASRNERAAPEIAAGDDRDRGYSREDIAAIRARRKAAREAAEAEAAAPEGPPL